MKLYLFLLIQTLSVLAQNCSKRYGQCGGTAWTGSTCCESGFECIKFNEWFSMCTPSTNSQAVNNNYSNNNNNNSNNNYSNNNYSNNGASSPVVVSTIRKTKTIPTNLLSKTVNNVPSTNPPVTMNTNTNGNNSNGNYVVSNASSSSVEGYGAGTTGGAGGKTINVSSGTELASAASGNSAKIIIINGIIKISSEINVGSNTSIIGNGSNSGITGAGLKMKGVSNVIIQNLKLSYCLGSNKDCIHAEKSTKIWVDHCELYSDRTHGKDYYDGLVDFTHACDSITVSWCYLHDHHKASLIGHSDSNASEDTGKLHITYHHNYFKNIGSRLPSLRFGTGHIYNNVFENVESSCVNVRMGAQALVEGNVFKNAKRPISTDRSSKEEGFAVERNNDFGSMANTNSITNPGSLNKAPYSCNIDSTSSVYSKVTGGAGAGK